MQNENTDQSPKIAVKITIAAFLVLVIPLGLFLVYSHKENTERKKFNSKVLEIFKDEYTPKVESIMVSTSIDEMISQMEEQIEYKQKNFEAAKIDEALYFKDLPEEIQMMNFESYDKAYGFFYSAIKKIMDDLENDPSIDARKKEKEYEAIRYFFMFYNYQTQINFLKRTYCRY